MSVIPPDLAALLVELIEKVGLLRRDIVQKKEIEKYEARFARIEQKLSALAERVSADDQELAKKIRTAWQLPARSLAFRNADHQKELKQSAGKAPADEGAETPEDGNTDDR